MNKLNFYTAKELKPTGWLRRQLEIQANGLSGNLDKMWRDVRDSAWIGGDAEAWERVPYWLDGFIPLAYLLEDEDMIARAKKYVDAILEKQKPSGWICPCPEENIPKYDTWALQLISKVLVVYYECSGDERIPDALYRAMKNYYELLSNGTAKLFVWAHYRWFEAFIALNFLYERYKEDWIKDLARILKEQGLDYTALTDTWKRPLSKWVAQTHIVNVCMMLKYEAITCDLLGEEYTGSADRLSTILSEYNGTPVGLFTGDECLSGLSPIQGTELCGVAEQMYSLEWLYAKTQDPKWAEWLELVAFNALPATISDDMWTHQYLQQSNQIACEKFPYWSMFRTDGPESHLFGLEPNYGCCTANFNQAWPKLALSAFMHSGSTVVSAVPIPSVLNADGFTVELCTNYPFENKLEYTVKAEREMTLKVRVPSFAKNLKVNGTPSTARDELDFTVAAGSTELITVTFDTVPTLVARPHDLKCVKCGSLVFSLPISYEKKMYEYERDGVERKFPYCDYELLPTSEWSFGYSSPFFTLERRELPAVPFSSENPPLVVKAQVQPTSWGKRDGYDSVCAMVPESRTPIGEAKEIELYPYGCAKLRMTELPLI